MENPPLNVELFVTLLRKHNRVPTNVFLTRFTQGLYVWHAEFHGDESCDYEEFNLSGRVKTSQKWIVEKQAEDAVTAKPMSVDNSCTQIQA